MAETERVIYIKKYKTGTTLFECPRCGIKTLKLAVLGLETCTQVICVKCIKIDEWPDQPIYIKSNLDDSKFIDLSMRFVEKLRLDSPHIYEATIKHKIVEYALTKL